MDKNILIRTYQAGDKNSCMEIFRSNSPLYFDKSEEELFARWLDHQSGESAYQSPTYTNSEKDAYYVIVHPQKGIVACGGFYILKDKPEARLAWGMVHAGFHTQGYGSALYRHRRDVIKENWPKHIITLGTSQHTWPFYEKMGMAVIASIRQGYGPELDRYDMELPHS